jgi:hypothetical protein
VSRSRSRPPIIGSRLRRPIRAPSPPSPAASAAPTRAARAPSAPRDRCVRRAPPSAPASGSNVEAPPSDGAGSAVRTLVEPSGACRRRAIGARTGTNTGSRPLSATPGGEESPRVVSAVVRRADSGSCGGRMRLTPFPSGRRLRARRSGRPRDTPAFAGETIAIPAPESDDSARGEAALGGERGEGAGVEPGATAESCEAEAVGAPEPVDGCGGCDCWGGCAGTGAGAGWGAGAGGAAGAGGGLVAPRGGSRESGSTYVSSSPRRTPKWTYETSCSASPEGPASATGSPSSTCAPRFTSNGPRCVREALNPPAVVTVTVRPCVGTVPANVTSPLAGERTTGAPARATSTPRCCPPAYVSGPTEYPRKTGPSAGHAQAETPGASASAHPQVAAPTARALVARRVNTRRTVARPPPGRQRS